MFQDDFFLGEKELRTANAYISLGTVWGVAALWPGGCCLLLQTDDCTRVSAQARHYFSAYITTTDRHHNYV